MLNTLSKMKSTTHLKILMILLCSLFVTNCVSLPEQEDIIAIVEGDPVAVHDLEYALEIAHRREDLSSASSIKISDYIHALIDERLVIHEAKRMGMDEYPEVQKKLHAYILRESVVKLHEEEILQKASITEEEVISYYKNNYDSFTVDIINVNTQEDAAVIAEKLREGESFKDLAALNPSDIPRHTEDGYTFKRMALGPLVKDTIINLQPGEITEPIADRDKFIIITLLSKQEAPDEELAHVRANIEGSIRSQKITEREAGYVIELREKANITIDNEILSSISLGQSSDDQHRWAQDSRPLVTINTEALTVGNFVAMLPSSDIKIKERIMNNWIAHKVVDQEALSRDYEIHTSIKSKVNRYRNQLLQSEFSGRVIAPTVLISENDLQDYYSAHKEEYRNPTQYKIQQVTLDTEEEAQAVLDSLRKDASFSWIVKTKSTDDIASMGGFPGWKTKDALDAPVRDIIDTLSPGDISVVLKVNSVYRIIRLQEKSKEKFDPLEKIRAQVHKKVFEEKFHEMKANYIAELKKEAKITINDRIIQSFEEIFKK